MNLKRIFTMIIPHSECSTSWLPQSLWKLISLKKKRCNFQSELRSHCNLCTVWFWALAGSAVRGSPERWCRTGRSRSGRWETVLGWPLRCRGAGSVPAGSAPSGFPPAQGTAPPHAGPPCAAPTTPGPRAAGASARGVSTAGLGARHEGAGETQHFPPRSRGPAPRSGGLGGCSRERRGGAGRRGFGGRGEAWGRGPGWEGSGGGGQAGDAGKPLPPVAESQPLTSGVFLKG